MSDYILRKNTGADSSALQSLWTEAFGDSEAFVQAFFDRFVSPGSAMVAEQKGEVVSAMYLLEGPVLLPYRKNRLTTGYCYGLATRSDCRKQGIGSAVYQATVNLAFEKGYDAACVLPAEEELYPFYQKSGARQISAVREHRYTRAQLAEVKRCMCARVDVTRYGGIRESLLPGDPHGVMNDDFYEWQEEIGDLYGGGLFVLDGGIAAVCCVGDTCTIHELLFPRGDEKAAVAAIAAFCPAENYIVHSPACWDGDEPAKPFMLAQFRQEPGFFIPDDCWWGFAFE